MSELVRLNVGGEIFLTTKSTLTKYPESMLGAMFNNGLPTTKDENGYYFIDRDGTVFRHILNFLRSSQLSLPGNFRQLDLLAVEADFYQIQPLIEAIKKLLDKSNNPNMKKNGYLIEIVEVRTGSTATMPTNNSRVKTVLKGRKDVIITLPVGAIHGQNGTNNLLSESQLEKLQSKTDSEFAEVELNGCATRVQLAEYLHNAGWELLSSNMCSSSANDNRQVTAYYLVTEHSYRDLWFLPMKDDPSIVQTGVIS